MKKISILKINSEEVDDSFIVSDSMADQISASFKKTGLRHTIGSVSVNSESLPLESKLSKEAHNFRKG